MKEEDIKSVLDQFAGGSLERDAAAELLKKLAFEDVGFAKIDHARLKVLLECLLRHPGQVLNRDQLLDYAWPYGDILTHNTVDTYVHYLRDKLGKASDRIKTVRGVGYRMAEA